MQSQRSRQMVIMLSCIVVFLSVLPGTFAQTDLLLPENPLRGQLPPLEYIPPPPQSATGSATQQQTPPPTNDPREELLPQKESSSSLEQKSSEPLQEVFTVSSDGSTTSRRPPRSPPPRFPVSSSSPAPRSSAPSSPPPPVSSSSQAAGTVRASSVRFLSSSVVSSSVSSSRSSVPMVASVEETPPCTGSLTRPERYKRECFWYSDPIIPPNAILSPSQFRVTWVNSLLAILTTIIVGLSGLLLLSFGEADAKRVRDILRRLPSQAFVALVIVWLIRGFVPEAAAQGVETAGVSLFSLYLYVGVFFVVVNLSNFIFNNIITSEGDRVHDFIVSHPMLHRFVSEGRKLSHEKWLIVLLLIAYGVIGAHISPSFSLLPQEQIGVVFVTTGAIILSAYFKDFVRFLLARVWKFPSWFKANVAGLFVAFACVALTRSLELSPGYIYGVPVGLFIAAAAYQKREGLFESLGLLWLMVLALILWMCTPFLAPYPVLHDALNLFFVIAIEHAFIETFPLPYLAGGSIFHWRKWVWAIQFSIIVFLLFQTLFNPKGTIVGLVQSPPAAATLVLLGAYVIGVLWLWLYILWGRKKGSSLR